MAWYLCAGGSPCSPATSSTCLVALVRLPAGALGRTPSKAQRTVGTAKVLYFAPAPVKRKVSARDACLGCIRSVRALFELSPVGADYSLDKSVCLFDQAAHNVVPRPGRNKIA